MEFVYKSDIVKDVLLNCNNLTLVKSKYYLNDGYIKKYFDYCLMNNYINKIKLKNGSEEFLGYEVTNKGKLLT